jgi:hypothetical protein
VRARREDRNTSRTRVTNTALTWHSGRAGSGRVSGGSLCSGLAQRGVERHVVKIRVREGGARLGDRRDTDVEWILERERLDPVRKRVRVRRKVVLVDVEQLIGHLYSPISVARR